MYHIQKQNKIGSEFDKHLIALCYHTSLTEHFRDFDYIFFRYVVYTFSFGFLNWTLFVSM